MNRSTILVYNMKFSHYHLFVIYVKIVFSSKLILEEIIQLLFGITLGQLIYEEPKIFRIKKPSVGCFNSKQIIY